MKEKYGEFSRWCDECGNEFHRDEMRWSHDCHGIPFRHLCPDCYENEMRAGYDGQYYDHMDETIEPDDWGWD